MDLEPLDLLLDGCLGRQESRHDDDRAQARRHAVSQFQAGQKRRTKPDGDVTIYQRYGGVEGRKQTNNGESDQRPPGNPDVNQEDQRHGEHERADDGDDREITRQPHRRVQASKPALRRRAESELSFECPAPARYEVVAGVPLAFGQRITAGRRHRRGLFGRGGRALGDLELRVLRAAGQLFDGAPVEISRGKIHLGEFAVGGENAIDQADFLEEFGPIDGGYEPHAGDDIADRHVGGGLPLMLCPNRLVGGRSLRGETAIQPEQRRRHPRILIAQPLDELDGKGPRQRRVIELLQHRVRRLRRAAIDAEQPVRQSVGFPTRRKAVCDSLGGAPQVLDEHDSQRDRDRPEFADGQRLDMLIGAYEAYQHLAVEAAVGMGDKGPGQSEDAGIALERPIGQFRQLAVETGRQITPDVADLRFDDRKIIEQPFGGRRDRAIVANRLTDAQIRITQGCAVVFEPDRQFALAARFWRHRLRGGVEPLYAEEFFSDQLVAGLMPCRQPAIDRAQRSHFGSCLPGPQGRGAAEHCHWQPMFLMAHLVSAERAADCTV